MKIFFMRASSALASGKAATIISPGNWRKRRSGSVISCSVKSARRAAERSTEPLLVSKPSACAHMRYLPAGKYRMWAQALGFETSKGSVDLSAARRADFTLQEMTDPERRFRQLPGEMMVAALPEASADDARMKKIFMNNCTGCHSTSYVLQFRFDEAGWSKIIDLMKVVPVTGVYPGPDAKPSQIIQRHQKQLAAYLARARGPGESSMKVVGRARPA